MSKNSTHVNVDEFIEFVAQSLNNRMVGQHGIAMSTQIRPKYVGTFVSAKTSGCNLAIRFSEELVLWFTPLGIFNIVEEQNEHGGYGVKHICDEIYIGDHALTELLKGYYQKLKQTTN